MKTKLCDIVMSWKTFVSVTVTILSGIIWLGTMMWDVKSGMTDNRIEVIREIADLKKEQIVEIGFLRNEIIQYHTILGTLQEQYEKHEERARNHVLDRSVHN